MNCPACGSTLRSVDGLCPTCVARSMTTLLSRRVGENDAAPAIEGYELGEQIGRGGMGIVFRAWRIADGHEVAIKLMAADFSDRDDLSERFAREVDALTALEHPHVLRVLDSGLTDDGRWFLVTELAATDLARRLRDGALPEPDALRIFREVAAAIGEAHRRGIAHRDIKPANILLTADGSVRVADFSLAKLIDAAPDLTRSVEVFGTPYYIAPEVRRGAVHADERADIFSLGVLLHEMLTGRLPIGEYEPAPRHAAIIARCLREDPARRPACVDELLRELDRAPRSRVIALGAALVLAASAISFVSFKATHPATGAPPSLAAASAQQPWQNSLGMKFVPVPGTRVLFSIWETRRRDFEAFAQGNERANSGANHQWRVAANVTADHPVQPVSMLLATEFCDWLTRTERANGKLPATTSYRLPTDEEWSRAAQLPAETGGTPESRHLGFGDDTHAPYVWGRTMIPTGTVEANYAGQERPESGALRHRDSFPGTAPVGAFQPNALGLFDLAGNVAEWCATPWNPRSNDRILRGAAFLHSRPSDLRLDARQHAPPTATPLGAGFRVVLDRGN